MTRRFDRRALLGALSLAGCASAPAWQPSLDAALRAARAEGRELVVYFALPGRELSERMQRTLTEPIIGRELGAGGFAAALADGVEQRRLYAAWVGFGEGMGIAVLGADGQCYAARPGPMDPPEFAAFLRLCTALRPELAAARAAVASPACTPADQLRLGSLYLQLGRTKLAEEPLLAAATAGMAEARHRLARSYALDGNLTAARRWLVHVPKTGPVLVTEGYLLFKERRHGEAAAVLEQALANEPGDDRQRAMLYLGKALHEDRRSDRAKEVLEALSREGTGSTFEAAALHTLAHIADPQHGHSH
jgi:tetratricopeptide (TPR) repeat protein